MKWFITMDGPIAGVVGYALIEADSEIEAERIAFDMAYDHLLMYFDIRDYETEDEDEYWGQDWIYEDDVYSSVELYDPEVHDLYIN